MKRWCVCNKWGRTLDDRLRADARHCTAIGQKVVPPLPTTSEYAYHTPESCLAYTTTELAGPGCKHCYHGFYGRTALFEVLPVTPALRQSIASGTPVDGVEPDAQLSGRTLFENGCQAVEQGLTTFEELIRVLGMPHVR